MEFLINLTIKSTLILLLSGSVLWLLRNASATLRHWVISLTMMGLLGLPLLLGILPVITVPVPYLPAKQTIETTIVAKTKEAQVPEQITPINKEKSKLEAPVVLMAENNDYQEHRIENIDNQRIIKIHDDPNKSQTIPFSINEVLVGLWLSGMLFFIIKLLIGRYLIYQITIKSDSFLLPESLKDYVTTFTKRRVVLLKNKSIKTPMTWGGFKPVILLPMESKSWSETALKTVLLHELTHIRRNDYWLHTFGLITICLYWYNPLIWWMKKQQLLEREKACDEAVLNAGIPQQNYAQQLINIARQLSKKSPILKEHALPMAKVSQTKARVLAILNFDPQQFNFSKWKQWNWGGFYACLLPILAAFTPVGEVVKEHFNLPKLENVERFFISNQIPSIALPKTILPSSINEPIVDNAEFLGQEIAENQTGNIPITGKLEILETAQQLLPIPTRTEKIQLPPNIQKTGLYGEWKDGKSEFKISIYGDFKLIPTSPYVEVVSPDGIVIIEEYKAGLFGGVENELIVTKAPYDGTHRWDYRTKTPLTELPIIQKGTPIQFWSDNRKLKNWLAEHKLTIITELHQQKVLKKVTSTNQEWWNLIKHTKEWLSFRFVSREKLAAKLKRIERRNQLKLGKIPYKKLKYPDLKGEHKIIGNTALSGNDIGNKILKKPWNPKGTQYMTVLKSNGQPTLIKEFNFHLSKNDFNDLTFELQLYNIVEGEIKYAITKSPIPVTVKEGSGWIRKDLSNYGIVSQGDVLVVLENKGYESAKNGRELYFSLTENHQAYEYFMAANFEWKTKRILERDFVMYLGVEQTLDKIGTIEKADKQGYLVEWQEENNNSVNLTAEKIVETAIRKLKDNYIQKPYNADLHFKYSSLSATDSLVYQSEAMLKYYDSDGYQKKGWRNIAKRRFANLEEGRIVIGEQKEDLELREIGNIFVFWTHEPIITNDKLLSEKNLIAYNYELIGVKKFMGKDVFEIKFVCTNPKERFAGLPSLLSMEGKLYINQEDYAILKYEEAHVMDFAWKGKHPKKRGHLKERNVRNNTRVEIFAKNEEGYYLDYGKQIRKGETHNTLLDGTKEVHKGTIIEEYQYANITTQNVKPLGENLFDVNNKTMYNANYWEEFHKVLSKD